MKHFEAVIFDMDGLLLDSEKIALDTFLHACHAFELDDETDLFMSLVGTNQKLGTEILKKGLGSRVDVEMFIQVWEGKYEERTAIQLVPVKAGVLELLNHLKLIEVPAVVATSTQTERAERKLRNSKILSFFEFIVGGDQVIRSKPDPEIYLKAAEYLKVDPQKCLALEDSENGVISAFKAGCTVIQIPDLVKPSNELKQLGHRILDSLNDVRKIDFGSDLTQ